MKLCNSHRVITNKVFFRVKTAQNRHNVDKLHSNLYLSRFINLGQMEENLAWRCRWIPTITIIHCSMLLNHETLKLVIKSIKAYAFLTTFHLLPSLHRLECLQKLLGSEYRPIPNKFYMGRMQMISTCIYILCKPHILYYIVVVFLVLLTHFPCLSFIIICCYTPYSVAHSPPHLMLT